MDIKRFDAILRPLAHAPARRHVLRLLAGSTLGLLAADAHPINAKKKRHKHRGAGSPGGGQTCPQCP